MIHGGPRLRAQMKTFPFVGFKKKKSSRLVNQIKGHSGIDSFLFFLFGKGTWIVMNYPCRQQQGFQRVL